MAEQGKYIYGIINTNEARNFGSIGVGGRDDVVSTISYQDISAVISNFPVDKYELSKENLLAHQRVVERVVSDHTVLPVRAFTVAANAEEVRDFLRKRYRELTGLLKDMDNKASAPEAGTLRDKIAVGEMVASALTAKKEKEAAEIIRPLRKVALDLCLNDVRGDAMIVNAAFLVDRGWEKEFDSKVAELDRKYAERIRFKYIGPGPPYNFVNLRI